MPRPIDSLRQDHAVVALGISVLMRVGQHVRGAGAFPNQDVALLLRFLREFVIATHFRKEGDYVFPAVAMLGDEHAAGLVGEILRMQDEVTELVHSLVLFWEPAGELTANERLGFDETIVALAGRLDRMRTLEEEHLFTTCSASVPVDDQLDWPPAFSQLEARLGSRREWQDRIEDLGRRWLAG
jgi:hemerythrin-like domain-containing protein